MAAEPTGRPLGISSVMAEKLMLYLVAAMMLALLVVMAIGHVPD